MALLSGLSAPKPALSAIARPSSAYPHGAASAADTCAPSPVALALPSRRDTRLEAATRAAEAALVAAVRGSSPAAHAEHSAAAATKGNQPGGCGGGTPAEHSASEHVLPTVRARRCAPAFSSLREASSRTLGCGSDAACAFAASASASAAGLHSTHSPLSSGGPVCQWASLCHTALREPLNVPSWSSGEPVYAASSWAWRTASPSAVPSSSGGRALRAAGPSGRRAPQSLTTTGATREPAARPTALPRP
mmetsp:Transcript_4616/g.18506  ORF Transcript_4616/g.18506 Transcript_4616/m.18506 type:complete len:249 (+) Transcript_4616:311-1057(+)